MRWLDTPLIPVWIVLGVMFLWFGYNLRRDLKRMRQRQDRDREGNEPPS